MIEVFMIGITGFVLLLSALFSYAFITRYDVENLDKEVTDKEKERNIYYVCYLNFIINIVAGSYLMLYAVKTL